MSIINFSTNGWGVRTELTTSLTPALTSVAEIIKMQWLCKSKLKNLSRLKDSKAFLVFTACFMYTRKCHYVSMSIFYLRVVFSNQLITVPDKKYKNLCYRYMNNLALLISFNKISDSSFIRHFYHDKIHKY